MSLTLFKIGFLPVSVMDIVDIIVMSYILFKSIISFAGHAARRCSWD